MILSLERLQVKLILTIFLLPILQLLDQEMRIIGPNSFCALALGAEGPLLSALVKFPEEFEAYLANGLDPTTPPEFTAPFVNKVES